MNGSPIDPTAALAKLAGAEGFEPSNTGSKVPRLTAWPRPISLTPVSATPSSARHRIPFGEADFRSGRNHAAQTVSVYDGLTGGKSPGISARLSVLRDQRPRAGGRRQAPRGARRAGRGAKTGRIPPSRCRTSPRATRPARRARGRSARSRDACATTGPARSLTNSSRLAALLRAAVAA